MGTALSRLIEMMDNEVVRKRKAADHRRIRRDFAEKAGLDGVIQTRSRWYIRRRLERLQRPR